MENRETNKLTPYIRDISEIQNNWGSFFAIGLLLIILGSVAIYFNVFTTLFTVFFLGVLLVVSGVVQIAQSFLARRWSGLVLTLLTGILYIVVGFFCVARPLLSAASLTLLIAAFLLVGGLFRMIGSAFLQFDHWGWAFFNGLVTFILGVMIYSDWPVSGLWIIGLFVGIDMLLTGWSWLLLSLSARSQRSHHV